MDYNEDKQSKFNAGVALAERIAGLQSALNAVRYNLQQFNMETNTYNFQIFADSLDGLMKEVWSKANKGEKVILEQLNNLVRSSLKYRSPLEEYRDLQGNTQLAWNFENLEAMRKLFDIYEKELRIALDTHKLNSPNIDDDDEGL